MLTEGQKAPNFTLSDQDGNAVTLSSYKGTPVVLYFYPKDDTPGCTAEACAFRDARQEYEQAGAKVIGVSPDNVASHVKFARKHDLSFMLLADVDKHVCETFCVWKEKSMYGKKYMGVERTTFLIDREGLIRKIFPKVSVTGHAKEVLEALKVI
jgi:peroxiredoxin Q/BCP